MVIPLGGTTTSEFSLNAPPATKLGRIPSILAMADDNPNHVAMPH